MVVPMEKWTAQYPSLLEKNFLGIARTWDKAHPPKTDSVLPARNTLFNFMWRYGVDPGDMSPYVSEFDATPIGTAGMGYESFVCREARYGFQISERELGFGLPDIVRRRTQQTIDAINRRQEWECARALNGTNDFQGTARLNTVTLPSGSEWNQAGSDPIGDILSVKSAVEKACGVEPTKILMGWNEYEYLQEHSDVLDQLKYTDAQLLARGRLTRIKGLDIIVLGGYWKSQAGAKTFILRDKVIITPDTVGFTAVAEPQAGSSPVVRRWANEDSRSINVQAWKSFVPVIEDYAMVGVCQNTDSTVTLY